MINDEIIDTKMPIPVFTTRRCRFFALLMSTLLRFGSIIVAIIVAIRYDYFLAIAALLTSYIILGIVRSKIRDMVIPVKLQEFTYSDSDIAKLYLHQEVC